MEKTEVFSDCVERLTIMWIMWLKNNSVAHDSSVSYNVRREAAESCELLIKKRHNLIDTINSYFEE